MSASHYIQTSPTAATLFVCHSMGDTNVLLETARTMLTKTSENIVIFTIGQAAKTIFENLSSDDILKKSSHIKITSLAELFDDDGEQVMKNFENKALSQAELLTLKKNFLDKYNFTKALLGTPSQGEALIPFQIAEIIASHIDHNSTFIFNDYFYQEPAHAYWKVLAPKTLSQDWRQKTTWLAPLNTVKTAIAKVNPDVNVVVVGHPAIDAAAGQQPPAVETIAGYRKELDVSDQASLLFISGTKDQQDDKALLEAVLEALTTQDGNLQVRIGLHPGNQELTSYITTLLKLLEDERYTKIAAAVKFIVPDKLVSRIDPDLLKKSQLLRINITGDQAASAANGVASAVPATLVNQTAIMGRPAYYHQEKEPYLPKDRLFVGNNKLGLFMGNVMKRQQCDVISKKELDLPEISAAETITQILMKK